LSSVVGDTAAGATVAGFSVGVVDSTAEESVLAGREEEEEAELGS
jgi:hypothetical protein